MSEKEGENTEQETQGGEKILKMGGEQKNLGGKEKIIKLEKQDDVWQFEGEERTLGAKNYGETRSVMGNGLWEGFDDVGGENRLEMTRATPELCLMRMLQDMKRIESNVGYSFQTEALDPATFSPMYPNIIIVDQTAPETITPGELLGKMDPGSVGVCLFSVSFHVQS